MVLLFDAGAVAGLTRPRRTPVDGLPLPAHIGMLGTVRHAEHPRSPGGRRRNDQCVVQGGSRPITPCSPSAALLRAKSRAIIPGASPRRAAHEAFPSNVERALGSHKWDVDEPRLREFTGGPRRALPGSSAHRERW